MDKKKPIFLCLLLIMSVSPIIPVKGDEIHSFISRNIYESDLNLNKGELGLYAWNRESSIKFRVPFSPLYYTVVNSSRVEVNYGLFDVNIYELNQDDKHEYGGIEYEFILYSKPPSSAYAFLINSQNLDFYYQPPLYEELNPLDYDFLNATHAIVGGNVSVYRPIDVIGSYAVYHRSKKNNEYKTGKAFHIYRPKLIDANGEEDWANITIEIDTLRIDLPQSFLDSAEYPVIVDPSFGYETKGGTEQSVENKMGGSLFTITEDGTGDSITVYLKDTSQPKNAKCAIYKHSDLSLEEGTEELSVPISDAWKTFNFGTGPSLTQSTDYVLIGWCPSGPGSIYMYYDTGDTDQGHDKTIAYGAWPNPLTGITHNTNKWSIYCNYTTGAGPTSYVRDISQSLDWDGNVSRGQWILSRSFTQSLDWTGSIARVWSLSRSFSQSLTFTWNAYGTQFVAFLREISLSIDWVGSGLRGIWNTERNPSQSISFAFDLSRIWSLTRTFSQGLSFSWNAYGYLGVVGQQFVRSVTLGINWSSNLFRRVDFSVYVSQSFSFVFDILEAPANLLQVFVRTYASSIAIDNALVTISNATGGIEWVHYTNETGYTPEYEMDQGNYTVLVSKEDYQPYNLLFSFNSSNLLEVPLKTIEEGIVMNLEFLTFMFAGLLVMYYGIREQIPEKRALGFTFSMILWVATWAQWIFDNSTNNNIVLGWVFMVPIGLCMIYLTEGAIEYLDKVESEL